MFCFLCFFVTEEEAQFGVIYLCRAGTHGDRVLSPPLPTEAGKGHGFHLDLQGCLPSASQANSCLLGFRAAGRQKSGGSESQGA